MADLPVNSAPNHPMVFFDLKANRPIRAQIIVGSLKEPKTVAEHRQATEKRERVKGIVGDGEGIENHPKEREKHSAQSDDRDQCDVEFISSILDDLNPLVSLDVRIAEMADCEE